MEREIVKTDRRYRRNLFLIYLLFIVLITLLWVFAKPALIKYFFTLPVKERIEAWETVLHFFLMLFIPAAVYLILIGRRVCRFQAMPYPGMRVIHDTIIVRGKKALLRGRSMIVLGTLMIVLVVASMVASHRKIIRLKQHPLFRPIFYTSET